MSVDSHVFIDEGNYQVNNAVVAYHRRETNFGPAVYTTSSVVTNIRQLQTDLSAQHQHEKSALTELNQRFHLFVDRVQHLQLQNSKFLAAVADSKRQYSGIGSFDVKWDEHYLATSADLSTIRSASVDCKWDYELFQLQSVIYKQLMEIEHQWKDKRSLVLEDELKKSTSVLANLRTSCAELQREVQSLHAEYDNLIKQYLTLTYNWCSIKKERNKRELNTETLKSYIGFYKRIRSYSVEGFDASVSIQTDDGAQFWALEYDKIVKSIRSDFEAFYGAIYREISTYYERKTEEIETNVKQAFHYQQKEYEEFTVIYQAQQVEYEKVQMSLSYEKETLIKTETSYSKLEAEFKSIQYQNDEQFEAQSTDLHSLQESIMNMIYDVDEMRRSKANLETEIIVYRLLLEIGETEKRVTVAARAQTSGSDMMTKFVAKKQRRGAIGIEECASNGTYINLINYSTNEDIDISGWVLIRNIDSSSKLTYTIPNGVRLARGGELRIYAKSSTGTAPESAATQKLVNKDLVSWGTGNTIETLLLNQDEDEEALHLLSVASRKTIHNQ